jgi:hypothetical protein
MEISERSGMAVQLFRPTKNDAGGLRVSWFRWINGRYYNFTVDTIGDTRSITVYLHDGHRAFKRHVFNTI